MVEYAVMLKRYAGSTRPNVCIFRDENREKSIKAMIDYYKKNGFCVHDTEGRLAIADILLVEQEPIAGAPVLSEMSYVEVIKEVENHGKK